MVDLRVATTTGTEALLSESAVEEFKSSLGGELLGPDDEGYDQSRRVWNGMIDKKPALIARCSGVADVIACVNFARENGLLVAVRGGAHNAAGHGTCDGGLLIDLSSMKGVRVDPIRKTATAQPGLSWAELDRETQAFGLATTGGTISNTGIAGLTLGGGLGWLMGKHGLTCDNLLSADVVTADGRFLTANTSENEDLFWALRGGGGNFGVVTSFEYQIHPVGPMVLGGLVIHPRDRAKEMLQFYADYSAAMPDDVEAWAFLLTSPEGEAIAAMVIGYNGPVDEGGPLLEPARNFGPPVADTVGPLPYNKRQSMIDEGSAEHGVLRYWKSGHLDRLDDEAIDLIVDHASRMTSPMSSVGLFRVHGAVTRVPPEATAHAAREPYWDFNIISQWRDPAESDRHVSWTREFWTAAEPLTTGVYMNHVAHDEPERIRPSYGRNYDRLVALKNKYDPANLFRLNPNIKPTTSG